jgi:2-polyprenyl-3-methyl-5-hydroxy-6-metoxy-1,4-benzoquinol methylase
MVQPRSRVLEIGAGPGSITKRLLGTLECDVVALEVEATAIAKLREFCPKVYDMDLNDAGWVEALLKKEGRFDYVIAADVLEHVYDPWKVLGGMRQLLTPTGSVILSLPHVGHAAVLGCLVDEDMQYGPWGLLDRTHVRFFGVKNVQSLYRSQGMAIEEAQFVVRTPEMTEFVERWRRLPEDVRAALQRNRFSHVYQVVTRAVPADRATRNLDLMEQAVEPADVETERYWIGAMASLPADPAIDRRSTIPGHDVAEVDVALAPVDLDALRQKITARGQDVRLIAFYLTQFHPIPENDRWWGKGFTEWTNVAKAQPRFKGHYQPHLPADLGYYDLRVPDVMREQIAMAKAHGIDGFCYYFYWFSGHRLLERPLDAMLADPDADMPFCLCWANENWTRAWDAGNKEILIAQEYRPEDNLEFIKSLEPYFRDPRYIRVSGAPLLLVYRPQHLPDARAAVKVWRDYCREVGIGEIHVASALTHGNWDYRQFGYDAGVEFPPHNMQGPDFSKHVAFSAPWHGYMPDYSHIADMYLNRRREEGERVYRGVFPSWDNTARRGDHGVVIMNGTPENYERWLAESIRLMREELPRGEGLVFINAWNEWAEGCHLEPCRKFGHRFLEATLHAKAGSDLTGWTHVGLPPGIGLSGVSSGEGSNSGKRVATQVGTRKPKKKSALSQGFRAVRDTLNGRRFKK